MRPIRLGVIGTGHQGKFYVQKLAAHPDVHLAAVCDANPFCGKQVAQHYQIPYFQNHHDLIQQVDAVFVVVPVTSHFDIVRDCLTAKKDVFVEKALASTSKQGEDLIGHAKETERILQVGHSERFNLATELLQQNFRNPSYIEAYRLVEFSGRGCDVDVITDLMIHDIDIVLNLLGENNPEIHAIGTPVISRFTDIADVHLRFNNHCEVHLKASRVSTIKERSIKVFEPNRCMVADFIQQDFTVYHKENDQIQINRKESDKRDILDFQVGHFIHSVRKRSAPLVSGEEGLETLRLVDKIRNSLQEPTSKENYVYGHSLRRSEQAI